MRSSSDIVGAIRSLTDEIRSERLGRHEFTGWRLTAVLMQLAVFLLAALAIITLASSDLFVRWMLTAILLQLVTIALVLMDRRS